MKRLCCQCKKPLNIEYLLYTNIQVSEIQLRAKCPHCNTIQILVDVCDKNDNIDDAKKFKEQKGKEDYIG